MKAGAAADEFADVKTDADVDAGISIEIFEASELVAQVISTRAESDTVGTACRV